MSCLTPLVEVRQPCRNAALAAPPHQTDRFIILIACCVVGPLLFSWRRGTDQPSLLACLLSILLFLLSAPDRSILIVCLLSSCSCSSLILFLSSLLFSCVRVLSVGGGGGGGGYDRPPALSFCPTSEHPAAGKAAASPTGRGSAGGGAGVSPFAPARYATCVAFSPDGRRLLVR